MKRDWKSILPKAAAVALVAAVVVYCIMLNIEKNAMKAYEKSKVLVAARDIAGGITLTRENMDHYITEKELDKTLIPERAVTTQEELYQQMVRGDTDKGAIITASMLGDMDKLQESMREPVIAGFKAEDLYQVVSGTLRSGDRIHIYTVEAETGNAYLVWDDVFIKEVFDSSGNSISADNKGTSAQRINILLEKENVEQFYTELATGSLRVVKVVD